MSCCVARGNALAFLLSVLFVASAQAATLTVNTTADPSAPSACSLRDAINSINGGANSGGCVATGAAYGTADTINFNIAGSGVHTIALASNLPFIAKPMIIDGYSQPGASANTNGPGLGSNGTLLIEIDATNVGNGADTGALTVGPGGGGTTIQGLVINRYVVNGIALVNSGGGNVIYGNYIGINAAGTAAQTIASSASGIEVRGFNGGTETGDIIGNTTPATRNVIAGNNNSGQIRLESSAPGAAGGIQIFGNFIGTNAAGTASLSITGCASSAQAGIRVIAGWPSVGIGAAISGAGNLISGNCARGLSIGNDSAINGTIDGNFIGTDVTGTVALGNQGEAIELFQVGSFAVRFNVISAAINTTNNGTGIDINGVTAPTLIQGNMIGTDLTGTQNLGNQGSGIAITSSNGVQIVGSNVIAFNGCCQLGGMPGVQINSGTGISITNNVIFGNSKLGIDLAPIGVVNPNNTATPANNGQNYPVITSAAAGGGSVTIQGTLDSAANANYELDFFSNPACDPLGNGQGRTHLGSTTVTTDGSGHATFSTGFTLSGGVVITSTATKVVGGLTTDTSEFSACVAAAVSPPTISKAFGAPSISQGGSTSLSFTIANPNASTTLTGIGFTDSLPSGLVVSTPNGLTGSCGGGTITAVAASGSVSLSGASLAGSASCIFSINVNGTTSGVKNNTTSAVTSVEGGSGGTASASVTVTAATLPPTISKAFGAASISQGGSTSLSFTITNPNSAALTGVGFGDTLPAGLVVSTPNGLTGSCGGGTITAVAGSGSVSLSGATLAASAPCTFSVNVTGTSAGTKNNTTGAVTSVEGGSGNTASASVTVTAAATLPPTIAKSFGTGTVVLNGSTSLTFTLQNPNASSLTGVGFTDSLPAGLVVATPNGLTGSCGGAITGVAGSSSITLTGATLASSASCTFGVNVTGTTTGTKINTTGAVTSNEGGTGGTASASVNVSSGAPPPSPAAAIPTLQEWAVWLLGLMLLVIAGFALHRRND
jgi:CSLREA domain-containing protein